MNEILNILDNLPDKGKIAEVQGKLLGKTKMKYICQNDHVNDPDTIFCSTCDLNIKGLTINEVGKITNFREKVNVLNQLFTDHKE